MLKPKSQSNNPIAHRTLGYVMAFIGGAINAGGFFAVHHYTSHMSGELARVADHLSLQNWPVALSSALMVLSFIIGAGHGAFTTTWAKYGRFRSPYAITFCVEAVYMLLFGLMASRLSSYQILVPIIVLLMCFIMGMHNTIMTMLSNGTIRSTHMTGFVTDIGIELGKFCFFAMQKRHLSPQGVDWSKLTLCVGLVLAFLGGGVFGAWGFHKVQFHFVLPLSALLLLIALVPMAHEIRIRKRVWQRKRRHNRP